MEAAERGKGCLLAHSLTHIRIPHLSSQVVNLHYLLSKAKVAARPSVLWCYKKDLGFTR